MRPRVSSGCSLAVAGWGSGSGRSAVAPENLGSSHLSSVHYEWIWDVGFSQFHLGRIWWRGLLYEALGAALFVVIGLFLSGTFNTTKAEK